MILFITNTVNFHYEVVINIIEKYDEIIQRKKSYKDQIYLSCYFEESFVTYVKCSYPNIIFGVPKRYDYYINCTVYPKKFKQINDGRHFYICHEVFNTVSKNVLFLTPLNNNNHIVLDYLPFKETKVDLSMPIYIIQGNLSDERRNFKLLKLLLEQTYEFDFKVKILGRGKLNDRFNKYENKLLLRYNLDFIDYHKEFLGCYSIIPLISKKTHPQYYTNKLTSSINYGLAYNLNFLLDRDLQDIYKLNNAYVYTDEEDIVACFKKSLEDFYTNRASNCTNCDVQIF
jgi:hypothetical protein